MIEIQIKDSNHYVINQELIRFAVAKTLSLHDESSVDVTILFTDNTEVRQLNKSFRNIDKTTDVLAFNQDVIDPETGHLYLGDVVISLDQASQQAPDNGLSLNEECALLAIHGTLHLLGYDHKNPKEKADMWALQDKMLTETIQKFQECSE